MPFYRFEDLESHYLTPHLSTGKAPVIEGKSRTRPGPWSGWPKMKPCRTKR